MCEILALCVGRSRVPPQSTMCYGATLPDWDPLLHWKIDCEVSLTTLYKEGGEIHMLCEEHMMRFSCILHAAKELEWFHSVKNLIMLNEISSKLIHILPKVRLMGRTDIEEFAPHLLSLTANQMLVAPRGRVCPFCWQNLVLQLYFLNCTVTGQQLGNEKLLIEAYTWNVLVRCC